MDNKYELLAIIHPDFDTSEAEKEIKKLCQKQGISCEFKHSLGRRQLSKPIQKLNEGYYLISQLVIPDQKHTALIQQLRLQNFILRFLITKLESSEGVKK